MKRLSLFALCATLIGSPALAADSAAGGLEFSGHASVVSGWQHDDNSTVDLGSCSFGVGILGCNAVDAQGSGYGPLGDFRGLGTPNRDTFNFYVDEVELDVQKSFGDNLRVRFDIDLGRFLSGTTNLRSVPGNSVLEQGYVTMNFPLGNGIEILLGRFNAPIGYESVDRVDNTAISYSNIYRYVRPHNLTGAKFYYALNDRMDFHVYAVNNLSDTFSFSADTDSAYPSWGARFGLTFGDEDRPNTIGASYVGGPEVFGQNAHLTHMVDADFKFHFTESLFAAGEVAYRQDNVNYVAVNGLNFNGLPNSKVIALSLLAGYNAADIFDFWFRYGYLHDINPTGAYAGIDAQLHDFSLGAGYEFVEGAKVKLEYRLDLRQYADNSVALLAPGVAADGDDTSISQGFAAEFAYKF